MRKKLIVSILLAFMIFVVGGHSAIAKSDDGVVVFMIVWRQVQRMKAIWMRYFEC